MVIQEDWHKTFDKAEDDCANSLIQTADGDYALAGLSGASYSVWDMLLVKFETVNITDTTTTGTSLGFEYGAITFSLIVLFLFSKRKQKK